MKYQLVYTKKAVRDIEKLDIVAKKRLKKALEKFLNNPFYYAKQLVGSKAGDYRFRVGSYRIIFDVDKNKIIILRVAHRREIYRNL